MDFGGKIPVVILISVGSKNRVGDADVKVVQSIFTVISIGLSTPPTVTVPMHQLEEFFIKTIVYAGYKVRLHLAA